MNKADRKELSSIINDLKGITMPERFSKESRDKFMGDIDDAARALNDLMDSEQEKYDNMPEGLQQAERGQEMEEIIAALDQAVNTLDSIEIAEDVSKLGEDDTWEEVYENALADIESAIDEVEQYT